jgi:hypothetical protein
MPQKTTARPRCRKASRGQGRNGGGKSAPRPWQGARTTIETSGWVMCSGRIFGTPRSVEGAWEPKNIAGPSTPPCPEDDGAILFLRWNTLDRYYTKPGAALTHRGCVMILWRVIPVSHSVHTRKFEYCDTTRHGSVAFKRRVLLAASQIAGAIFRKNLARKLGVFLLNRLRSCRSCPLYDNERGALLLCCRRLRKACHDGKGNGEAHGSTTTEQITH